MAATASDSKAAGPDVVVVGSCNMDLISYVPRLPVPGETLHGHTFKMGFGGKGANQAVMAAKLGASVAMVSKVGQDSFGDDTIKNFKSLGVDTTNVLRTADASTGVAPIAVDDSGRNSIIIVAGANLLLTADEVRAAAPTIQSAKILLTQLEVSSEATLEAMRIARKAGVTTVFNPAPAKDILVEMLRLADIVCPNETETALITGMPTDTLEQCETAAQWLMKMGPRVVLLTLGERGSLVVTADGAHHVPAPVLDPRSVVDTSGAGDCFLGSFAVFRAQGVELLEAVRRACAIASLSVQKPGTQTSYPSVDEVRRAGIEA